MLKMLELDLFFFRFFFLFFFFLVDPSPQTTFCSCLFKGSFVLRSGEIAAGRGQKLSQSCCVVWLCWIVAVCGYQNCSRWEIADPLLARQTVKML